MYFLWKKKTIILYSAFAAAHIILKSFIQRIELGRKKK